MRVHILLKRRRTLLSAVLALGAGVAGYFYYFQPPVVTVSLAERAPVSEVVYGTGTVEPIRWTKVVPFTRGRLTELCRCEGQLVRKGQVLARQDDGEERASLHELEAGMDQLERDLGRSDKDLQKGAATKQQNERIKTQIRELTFRISAQKERINALALKAPLDGMILRRDGELGEMVGPTDVLFWVGSPTPMQVVAEINEEEISKIAVGQKVLLQNEAFPGQSLSATVSQITPKGNPDSKTFRAYLLLPRDTPLQIGMTVEVNIVFREKANALVVPVEAVAGDAIQVVRGDRISLVRVATGIRGSRLVEGIGDVAEGARVVSPARKDLSDGTEVRTDLLPAIPRPETQYAEASLDDTRSVAHDAYDARPTAVDGGTPPRASTPTRRATAIRETVARASDEGPRDATSRPTSNQAASARVPPIANDARRSAREIADKATKESADKARWALSKVERKVAGVDVKRLTRIGRNFLLSVRGPAN
jgi:RND family efflux transporter MFP subunit